MDCTYTDFTQLYTTPFSLTSLFAVRQKWQNGVLFRRDSPRKSTGLIYLHRCNGQYTAADGTAFDAQPGSVVCLPAGSCYSVYNHDCAEEQDDAFLVEFNLHNAGKLPHTYIILFLHIGLSERINTSPAVFAGRQLCASRCRAAVRGDERL